jgi:aminopeptidase N
MMTAIPKAIHLKDYALPDFIVTHVDLTVALAEDATRVTSVLSVRRHRAGATELVLDGEGLEFVHASVDGAALNAAAVTYGADQLRIPLSAGDTFKITIVQICNPRANTALSGLYLSSGIYCTQMEAEGFRRFAFMQDRPDVMATYHVRIEAPRTLPVLLSNGNPVANGMLAGDRHFAEWDDPHPKPTYLFALVAGDMASVHDTFTTMEGRTVRLGIYVEKGKEDRCAWAMESLIASMRWDEERFGRAYDLDVFNIVAVSDFNMGAMENKGLNVFNDKYILARPDTATDTDYVNIERIIAHEYFHNWTGNRITCRDWFQLCLKEGLTVFRDQEFTSDLRSRDVKRIEDVRTLRARQFPEDQGPLAHAVRPESYIEINNFYTPTIYEKGAEICRMIQTLIGVDDFRKGMDIYFAKHDGTAATVEDFVGAMAEASGRDFQQLMRWYSQAGTPVVKVESVFDATRAELAVTVSQRTPSTPGQTEKLPQHIPLVMGLVSSTGAAIDLQAADNVTPVSGALELTGDTQTFRFGGLKERPVVSINRGFSAPIVLESTAPDEDDAVLLRHDTDSFNRWEAAQRLGKRALLMGVGGGDTTSLIAMLCDGLAAVLDDATLDNAFKALMLQLPTEAEIAAALGRDVDADRVHEARQNVRRALSEMLTGRLQKTLAATAERGAYVPDTAGTARRSLRFAAMGLLAAFAPESALEAAQEDYAARANMTAEIGALSSVLMIDHARVDAMLDAFLTRHGHDPLLADKWFLLQAGRTRVHAAQHVEALSRHSKFSFKTPNRVYALFGGFAGNLAGFHAADGAGYRLMADAVIKLNNINPQVAARMAGTFRSWHLYDAPRRARVAEEMERILAVPTLSKDVFEIISRTLAAKR